jgi:hypothetical protein
MRGNYTLLFASYLAETKPQARRAQSMPPTMHVEKCWAVSGRLVVLPPASSDPLLRRYVHLAEGSKPAFLPLRDVLA